MGWKALQAANDEVKEAEADKKAKAFDVTYEETQIAGKTVVVHSPAGFWTGTINPKRESLLSGGTRVCTVEYHDSGVWQN